VRPFPSRRLSERNYAACVHADTNQALESLSVNYVGAISSYSFTSGIVDSRGTQCADIALRDNCRAAIARCVR
jgi:hypothetical protein